MASVFQTFKKNRCCPVKIHLVPDGTSKYSLFILYQHHVPTGLPRRGKILVEIFVTHNTSKSPVCNWQA